MSESETEGATPPRRGTVRVSTRKKPDEKKDDDTVTLDNSGADEPDPARLPTVRTFTPPAPAVPFTAPSPVAPSAALVQREANNAFIQERKELAELLSGLEVGAGKTTLQLWRTQPRVHKGKKVDGFLNEYAHTPNLDEIKQQFGGGTFYWRIMKPGPNGSRPFGPTSAPFDIAADPIPPESVGGEAPQQRNTDPGLVDIAKMTIDKADRAAERAEERAEAAAREARQMLAQASAKKSDDGEGIAKLLLTVFNPQQQEARLAEERRLQEERLRAEREERRLEREASERRAKEERDAAERRFQQERDDANRRHQEQMKAMEIQAAAAREEARLKVEAERLAAEERRRADERNFQLQLEALKSNSQAQITASQQNMTMMIENFKTLDSMKMDFFSKQLSQKPPDPLDQILKMKEVADIFNGKGDEDDEPMWKQVLNEVRDTAREVGPSLLATAGIGANLRGAAPAGRQLPPGKRRRRRVAPGSVVVAEETTAAPSTTDAKPQAAAGAKPAPQSVADVDDNLPDDKEVTNGLTGITLPEEGADVQQVAELLVRNLDWAIEKDNTPEWIVNNVVKRFPEGVIMLLKAQSADDIVDFIEKQVPPTWVITSSAGIKRIREVHALMVSM